MVLKKENKEIIIDFGQIYSKYIYPYIQNYIKLICYNPIYFILQ